MAATEFIIEYLKSKFKDIRVIVPQLAMSGGTMIACSSNKILMGKHSSLGPFDPQIYGLSAYAVLEEFATAYKEISENQEKAFVWQPIIGKYAPTLVGECKKAIAWAEQIAERNLADRMFAKLKKEQRQSRIDTVMKEFGDHGINLSHSRHFSIQKCKDVGLEVESLEEDQKLQDAVLAVHHSFMHTLDKASVAKIVENHLGTRLVLNIA